MELCRAIESLNGATIRKRERSGFRNPIGQFFFSPREPDPVVLIERVEKGDGGALRSAAAEQIRRAVETNVISLPSLWAATAAGDRQALEKSAVSHRLDFALLSLLLRTSLKPSLQVWARDLKQSVDFDRWRRGTCPVCGSLPVITEILGKEGERCLRCGLCGADWAYSRLRCAFCGNRDHKTLGHITVSGEEEKYRLQTCDECRGYLKVVVTFEPTPVELLPVEDLATLHLDLIAADHGYTRTADISSIFDP
jgi:FdhE protein